MPASLMLRSQASRGRKVLRLSIALPLSPRSDSSQRWRCSPCVPAALTACACGLAWRAASRWANVGRCDYDCYPPPSNRLAGAKEWRCARGDGGPQVPDIQEKACTASLLPVPLRSEGTPPTLPSTPRLQGVALANQTLPFLVTARFESVTTSCPRSEAASTPTPS